MQMPNGIKSASDFEAGIQTPQEQKSFQILGAETLTFMLNDQVFRAQRQYMKLYNLAWQTLIQL